MKTHKKFISNVIFASLISVTALSGCANVKQTMGLEVPPPDEFTVITRPPLEIPPNFELRPPQPGAHNPKTKTASEKAKQAIIRDLQIQDNMPIYRSPGENAFAKIAKLDEAEPNIRKTVENETTSLIKNQESFADKLIFWKDMDNDPTKVLVDAKKENARINENSALGKPVNEGDVPTIKKSREGFLEGIF
jgi:hypothetical protein